MYPHLPALAQLACLFHTSVCPPPSLVQVRALIPHKCVPTPPPLCRYARSFHTCVMPNLPSPVQVRVCRDGEEYDAQVLHAWASCDVALLTVKDRAFWSGLRALPLGGLPHLQSGVRVSRGWSVWVGGAGTERGTEGCC